MKKVVLFLADGFEEIEALTPVDVLRRADVDVITVSITNQLEVTGSHAITVVADKLFKEVDFSIFDALILPGGMPGTNHLNAHQQLKEVILNYAAEGKLIGAICAAPIILGELELLKGKQAISYPGFEKRLKGAIISNKRSVLDENILTANGVGSAMLFALNLVRELVDEDTAKELAEKMMLS